MERLDVTLIATGSGSDAAIRFRAALKYLLQVHGLGAAIPDFYRVIGGCADCHTPPAPPPRFRPWPSKFELAAPRPRPLRPPRPRRAHRPQSPVAAAEPSPRPLVSRRPDE